MPRFFTDLKNITETCIYLYGNDVKHIKQVLRYTVGDQLILCDGAGNDYFTQIVKIEHDSICLEILSKAVSENEPKKKIVLFQSLIKSLKMDLVIQKAVELGVYKIIPVITEYTVVKINSKNIEKKISRWNRIALEAAKQCGRAKIPEVAAPVSLKECCKSMKDFDCAFALFENEGKKCLKDFLKCYNIDNVGLIGVLIGPEGGFSPKDIDICKKSGLRLISLGRRVLRSETAAIAALAILMYEMGEMVL